MEMYLWNAAIVLTKVLFYTGFAAATGYTFFASAQRGSHRNQGVYENHSFPLLTLILVLLALMANTVWFFARVGAMVEGGVRGAFDPDIVGIMWNSAIGETALIRGAGLLAISGIILVSLLTRTTCTRQRVESALLIVALITLAYSFLLLGHVSELGLVQQMLLLLHVFVMAWWLGALYPLKLACRSFSNNGLKEAMRIFGKQASYMVSLLIIAGVVLSATLVGSVNALLHSGYGQTLIVKLTLVVIILSIAARNKLVLVPLIENGNGRQLLARSISLEMWVAFAILLITAGLSSVVGPAR